MIKILFSSVGRRVELVQSFKNAANELKKELIIYGVDISLTAPALCFCDKQFIVPKISDANYIPTLLEICKCENINILIPTIDTDLMLLSEHKNEFENIGTKVLVSAPDKIKVCRDKRLTGDFFKKCGLNAPPTTDDIKCYNCDFPAFIKPKDGSSSINAYKVEDFKNLEMYSKQIPDYIIQPFISGIEFTVDIFCGFDGEPIYITPRVRMATRAGEVLKTKICLDETIIDDMKNFVKYFKPCGPVTVQLIKDTVTNKNIYIEINPRFGGGVPLSMKAGANSAKALIELNDGKKLSFMPNAAEDGAIFCRFDQSIKINNND